MWIDYVEVTGWASAVEKFYGYVSSRSILYRFLSPVADVKSMYRDMWSRGCRTWAVYIDNKLVALVDICQGRECVEAAVVVADRFQKRGYGKAIVLDFLKRLRGVRCIEAFVSLDNYPALKIARRLGAEIVCTDICHIKVEKV
ncbi:MAG: GNAT family N-acetyltransferase [Pyrobaculum sp.]